MGSVEGRPKNIFHDLKNDPETIKRREEKKERLNQGIQNVLEKICKRRPSWSESEIHRIDFKCLQNGERCIMWDDEGAGFYLILRWDWIKNQPKVPDSPGDSWNGRWYSNIASILKPPFLDTSLPAHKIAEWIDENTITIHYKLLPHIHEIRESKGGEYAYELPSENPYWQELLRQHAGSS